MGMAHAPRCVSVDVWHSPRLARWAGWGIVLLAGLLYLLTLDTGLRPDELRGGDLITHQYAQAQARPGNAPGYPLYTMGGWLWFRLTGVLFAWALNPIQRLSSYSTLWALVALLVLYHLVLRVTRGHWPVAALATLFYGVTYFFWYYSVTTEQYTSAVLQTLLIVWLAFRWEDTLSALPEADVGQVSIPAADTHGKAPHHSFGLSEASQDPPVGQVSIPATAADRYLFWMALVVGTCLANLVTVLFILPPLVWFVLSRQPGILRRPGLMARLAGLALLPLISYAYVYWRGAGHPEWRGQGNWTGTWAWFVDFLTTHQGRDELAPGLTLGRFFTGEFPALIWGELTVVGLAGALAGLWCLGRRRAVLVGATLAIYLVFCWADRFGNWYQVIMPAYPLMVLALAAGASALTTSAVGPVSTHAGVGGHGKPPYNPPRPRAAVAHVVLIGMLMLVAYRFALSLPRANQSWRPEDTGLDPGWAVLADAPQAGAVVIAENEEWLALNYLTVVWDAQPAIHPQPLCRPEPPQGTPPGSATYLTRRAALADPACLADRHRYAAGAELILAQTEPERVVPPSAQTVDLTLGDGMKVVGYEASEMPQPWSGALGRATSGALRWRLSLYWQAEAPLAADYAVSVRPQQRGQPIAGDDGQPLIQDHQPVWNAHPTSHWQTGEVVRDDFVLTLPSGGRPDGAQIVVYRAVPHALGSTTFETLGEAHLALR
jgi:hypothetical protein